MAGRNTMLNSLTDEELLRHFHAEHDPLTATPIADELAKRFEKLLNDLGAIREGLAKVREDLESLTA